MTLLAAAPDIATARQSRPDLAGIWVFAEDRTSEPPYSGIRSNFGSEFVVRQAATELTIERGTAPNLAVYRHPFDGSTTELTVGRSVVSSRAEWRGERLSIETTNVAPGPDDAPVTTRSSRLLWREGDALVVEATITEPIRLTTLSVYRHPPAETPEPAAAALAGIEALAWLVGAWVSPPGGASVEELWTPAAGGAMLGLSRTVAGSRMVAFEFLRIVARDGGLAYIAQPGGRHPPTEFVLTEVGDRTALFENPSHDYPKMIRYTLGTDGVLRARISDVAGLRPQEFVFVASSR